MVRLRDSWPFSLSSAPTVGNPCRPLQPESVSEAQSTPTNQLRSSSIMQTPMLSEPPRCRPVPVRGLKGADSPRGLHRGHSPGHVAPPGARSTGGGWSLPASWPDPNSLRQGNPDHDERYRGGVESHFGPELATGLGRGGAVLCLPGRGAPAVVHDQRHRGPELETPPRGPGPRSFSNRRGSPEAVVLGLEPVGERVDHAGPRVVYGQSSVRHPLRRALHTSHGLNRINRPTHTRNFGYCPGDRPPAGARAPLRTGRADCSASGSSLCRSVSHPLVMPVMA